MLLYTGDRNAAWVASLAAASSSLLGSWGTVGQVDTLAAFFALAAFYQYSRFHVRGESSLWIAGICAALALFTKQTMVAAPAAIFFCLLTRDRKKALWFAAILGGGVAAAVLAINAALDGRFLANTVFANMNPFSAAKFLAQFRYFVSISFGMLVIVAVSFGRMLRGRALAPCVYLIVATLVFLGTAAKIGSDTNYQIESTLLLAVCAAIGLHQIDFFQLYFERSKSWITLLLIPLALHMAIGYRVSANALLARLMNEKLFRAEIEQLQPYVQPSGGLVLSTDFNAMVRLRQRMDVEPLIYNLLVSVHVIDPEPVRRDLARGAFSTVILSEDVFQPTQFGDAEIGTLPPSQLDEVRKHYRLVRHVPGPFLDGVYVYQPVSERDSVMKAATILDQAEYHNIRFPYDPRRAGVWRAIARYLQPWVDASQPLLELGAGYGEFTREIRASSKWALDQNPALAEHWDPSVKALFQSALDPWEIPDASLGTVFASNFLEHFTLEEGRADSDAGPAQAPTRRTIHRHPAQLPAGASAILRRLHAPHGLHRCRDFRTSCDRWAGEWSMPSRALLRSP